MEKEKQTKDELLETTLRIFELINELAGEKIKHAPEKYIKLKLDRLFLLTEYLEKKALLYFINEFPGYLSKN